MRLPSDPSTKFPPGPGAGVDLEGAGSLPLGEAKLTALRYKPTGKRPPIDQLRVIAEELDKGRQKANFGLPLPRLLIVNCPSIHPEARCRLLLGDREN